MEINTATCEQFISGLTSSFSQNYNFYSQNLTLSYSLIYLFTRYYLLLRVPVNSHLLLWMWVNFVTSNLVFRCHSVQHLQRVAPFPDPIAHLLQHVPPSVSASGEWTESNLCQSPPQQRRPSLSVLLRARSQQQLSPGRGGCPRSAYSEASSRRTITLQLLAILYQTGWDVEKTTTTGGPPIFLNHPPRFTGEHQKRLSSRPQLCAQKNTS